MEKRLEIYESDIADYFFKALIALGYVPEEEELDDLAAVVFDYLVDMGLIDEEDIEMEE